MEKEVQAIVGPTDVPKEVKRGREALRDRFEAEATELAAPLFPRIEQLAADVDAKLAYSLVYRLQSQGDAHPNPHALDPFHEGGLG